MCGVSETLRTSVISSSSEISKGQTGNCVLAKRMRAYTKTDIILCKLLKDEKGIVIVGYLI